MDRDFAGAVLDFTLWRDPERVAEVIAEVAASLRPRAIQLTRSRRRSTNCWMS
jgi:hypothetical protein